jgi:hypothetical protein
MGQVISQKFQESYNLVDIAVFLKEDCNKKADGIAQELVNLAGVSSAVTLGGILLNQRVYPETTQEEMRAILCNVFPNGDIDQEIGILYPLEFELAAWDIWKDTGVFICEDERVTVTYIDGRWTVNPDWGYSDAGGVSVTAPGGFVLPDCNEGCLIGKVGEQGNPFYIGNASKVPGPGGNKLFLIANDDIKQRDGIGYTDNNGKIKVIIKRELL